MQLLLRCRDISLHSLRKYCYTINAYDTTEWLLSSELCSVALLMSSNRSEQDKCRKIQIKNIRRSLCSIHTHDACMYLYLWQCPSIAFCEAAALRLEIHPLLRIKPSLLEYKTVELHYIGVYLYLILLIFSENLLRYIYIPHIQNITS